MAMSKNTSIRREQELVALAREALADRIAKIDEPGLVATVSFKPQNRFEEGTIGYLISVPHPEQEGYQIASQPALRVKDATLATLGEAFDEGLTVIRNEIEKVDA